MLVKNCEVSPLFTCAHPFPPLCGVGGLGEKLTLYCMKMLICFKIK